MAFADTYEAYRSLMRVDEMVVINGRISARESSETKIMTHEIFSLEQARKIYTRNLVMAFETDQLNKEVLQEIKNLLSAHNGDIPVYINVKTPQNGAYVLKSKSLRVHASLELIEQLRDKIGLQNVWVGA